MILQQNYFKISVILLNNDNKINPNNIISNLKY